MSAQRPLASNPELPDDSDAQAIEQLAEQWLQDPDCLAWIEHLMGDGDAVAIEAAPASVPVDAMSLASAGSVLHP